MRCRVSRLSWILETRSSLLPIRCRISWKSRSRFDAFFSVGVEDVVRNDDDLAAGALEHVGQPVDDGFEQRDQDGFAAGAADVGLLGAQREGLEGTRLVIAHGDQLVAGEHEGHRRALSGWSPSAWAGSVAVIT